MKHDPKDHLVRPELKEKLVQSELLVIMGNLVNQDPVEHKEHPVQTE